MKTDQKGRKKLPFAENDSESLRRTSVVTRIDYLSLLSNDTSLNRTESEGWQAMAQSTGDPTAIQLRYSHSNARSKANAWGLIFGSHSRGDP